MPTLDQNLSVWDKTYDWSGEGDEWSAPWGGTPMQWWGTIFPRIHAFVPARSILEIAPGFGRWTQYLKSLCNQLTIIDLSPKCIEVCKQRFAGDTNISYASNDGKSLDAVADNSVDFCFTFDSLVHAEADVLEGYVKEISRKLSPDGVAFIHHSNLGAHQQYFKYVKRIPMGLRNMLTRRGILNDYFWRAMSMTSEKFAGFCANSGLRCVAQEQVAWRGHLPIDCFSVAARPGSKWDRPNRVVANTDFMQEVNAQKRLTGIYAAESFRKA